MYTILAVLVLYYMFVGMYCIFIQSRVIEIFLRFFFFIKKCIIRRKKINQTIVCVW